MFEINVSNLISRSNVRRGGVGVVSSDPLRDGREPLDARTPAAGVCC